MKKENINFKRLMTFAIVATMCLVVVPTVSADIPTEMVAYWKFDEGIGSTAYDETANVNDGTLSGGKFGNALEFDGVDDYVNVLDHSTLDITGDITLEAWIFINDFSTSAGYHMYIIGKDSADQRSYGIGVDLTWQQPQKPFVIIFHPGGSYKVAWGTSQLVKNQWYHIAGVFDESDDELTLYVNGVPQSIQVATSTVNPGTAGLRIGGRQFAGHECYFNGRIDEVRISDIARYDSNFAPQTSAFTNDVNTVALWHFDESVNSIAYDETTNDNDGTITSATWAGPVWTSGKINDGLSFDGVDDYVEVPDDNTLDISAAWTISAWLYWEDGDETYETIFCKEAPGLHPAYAAWAYNGNLYAGMTLMPGASTADWVQDTTMGTIAKDAWTHVSLTFDGADLRSYIDGVYTDILYVGEVGYTNDNSLFFGRREGISQEFKGLIDEVAIYDTALSADEISKFYCLGENFRLGYCESPTLTYTGDLVFSDTADVVLEATLTDSQETGMSGYYIDFYIDAAKIDTVGPTGTDGIANLTLVPHPGVGVYEVYAEVYCLQSDPALLAVYDPTEGFVTGGGWIYSDPGAYIPDPLLEGKANFGFVAKYKKGQSIPTGNTEFQFKAGDLNFHSSDYDWLVIAGTKAMYKGTGTINSEGTYKFMITAWDVSGGDDTFRIKIWEEDEFGDETIIYDNGTDIVLGGGQIKIHTN